MLALVVTALMLVLTLSGGATWFLRNVLGAKEELIGPSIGVLLVLAALPVPYVVAELNMGRLLRCGLTTFIGLAKGANVLAMALVVWVMNATAPGAGAMVGAVATVAGAIAEMAAVSLAVRQLGSSPAAGD